MSTENKIFCTAPFATMRIEDLGDGIVYKPGCVYRPIGKISTLDEFLHGKEMTDHRNNLCNGTVPNPGCKTCIGSEKLGLTSIRMHLNKKPYFSDKLDIKLLDVLFGNTCNLNCFMCSPETSSSIGQERTLLKFIDKPAPYVDNTEFALEAMDELVNLEQIDFIGGEFFLFKNNITLLDKVIEKNLTCRIVTNATVLTPNLLEKLTKIKKLELEFSVDGVDESYEFMRYPARWETTRENILTLKNTLPNAKMKFVYVVQPLNIQQIINSLEVLNKFKLKTHFQDLSSPKHLSWGILTETEKADLTALLRQQMITARITNTQKIEIEQFIEGIHRAIYSPEARDKCVDFLTKTLAHRKVSHDSIRKQLGIFKQLTNELTKD
jgi:sulfatase maturation enzyme AslB (radical SAM superfamily)